MDEHELDLVCGQLAKRIEREMALGLGQKWRSPKDLREKVVAYALACRATGEALAPVSERLGLIESTLARWLRQHYKKNGLGTVLAKHPDVVSRWARKGAERRSSDPEFAETIDQLGVFLAGASPAIRNDQ